MKRLLTVLRRLFLAGIASLIICATLNFDAFKSILDFAPIENFASIFKIYLLISPLLYIIFAVITIFYIRKFGQFAAFHQSENYFVSLFKCFGHDLISPFKNIKNFVVSLFSKEVYGRGIIIGRFVELIVVIAFCIIGVLSLI